VVSLLDLAPTLLDLAGLPIPSHMQGRSLADVIHNPSATVPGVAVTTMFGSVSLRTDNWRYTRYEDGSHELFRIPSDPDNSDNLADRSRFAAVIDNLDRQLRGELAKVGVTYNDVRKIVVQAEGADTTYFVTEHSVDPDTIADPGGTDTIRTAQDRFKLPDWAENFASDGEDPTIIIGNAKGNHILGGLANDRINGVNGHDTIDAWLGDDVISGGGGNDRIGGGAEDDTLYGGLGRDTLAGGVGRDTFGFNMAPSFANLDQITDFSVPNDTVRLDRAAFTALATGGLATGAFAIGAGATQADDRIIYNAQTGALLYDPNGSAAGGGVHFATLGAGLGLTAADFIVV